VGSLVLTVHQVAYAPRASARHRIRQQSEGNLASLVATPKLRSFFDGVRPLSPTSLEVWATCPYRLFLESALRVAPTQDPEGEWTVDAAEKGSLVHDALEQFFSELAALDRPQQGEAYSADDLDLLERLAYERLRKIEEMGDSGHPLVWEATRRDLLADLRTFLARDTAWAARTRCPPPTSRRHLATGRRGRA
jgi:ATP-dependent helicase/nuclease subunit B